MNYSLNRKNYREFKTIELNKKAPRAYFIPYTSKNKLKKTSLKDERFSSDLVKVLSGEWEFKYYSDISLLPSEIKTSDIDFDKITVPSTWQRTGYDTPAYINCPYPFDNTPPELPEKMPVGVYRKTFDIGNLNKNYIISFLGVIPCIDLYVNGKFVGYSEGAHNTAEFDLNDYLVKGENELVAVIHKWSTATFLECQDMFRENGIFRDVLLYELPRTYINDYCVRTLKNGDKYNLELEVELCGDCDGINVEAELLLGKNTIVSSIAKADGKVSFTFDSLDVTEWNAEVPTVYDLYITLSNSGKAFETLRSVTGFKTIEIDKTTFKFNDKKIKLKGVNHHDTHHLTGYVMNFDDLEKDVKLMKSLNVNAVRTSHYPPDAYFLTLCDIYGLYVVDEADIETHGAACAPHKNINLLSHDKKWAPRYVDRVMRMYYRDRNHPCITMWSLGNEAGGYACHDICYKTLKEACPEIPIHYESVSITKRHSYDVNSEMYTGVNRLIEIRERKTKEPHYKKKPMFLCEYCHAMGVGPGSLEEYWDVFYSDDIFMGGCIWEWADHSVYHEDGPIKFTYGGDHGEERHDGCFCVDGLNYPDRRQHTGAMEMKAVYRPIRAKYNGNSVFTFINTNRFRSSDYIKTSWELLKNGEVVKTGKIKLDIAPCDSVDCTIKLPKDLSDADWHINFIYFDKENEIAREQIALNECYSEIKCSCGNTLELDNGDKYVTVKFDSGCAVFLKEDGSLISYKVNGKEALNTSPASELGIKPNIYRALLDNDARIRGKWAEVGYDKYETVLCDFGVGKSADAVVIRTFFDLVADEKVLFKSSLTYTVKKSGYVDVLAKLIPVETSPEVDLPRFGVTFELSKELANVEYYGRGELENLPDFNAQSPIGIYKTTVEDMHEPYIRPQDNGNHGETRYVKFTDNDGKGIMICNSPDKFSFSAHNYTQKLLDKALHQEDLCDENTVFVSVDGFIRGTGSGSCGPDTHDEYKINVGNGLGFKFTIVPLC